jgi:hypothetical protein
MGMIEVDLIQFTTGPRQSDYAVVVEYEGCFAIFDLAGAQVMDWDGNNFQLPPADWTPEMQDINTWLAKNDFKFVQPPDEQLRKIVLEIASCFRNIKPVAVNTNP